MVFSFAYRQPSFLTLVRITTPVGAVADRPFVSATLRGRKAPPRTFTDVLVDTGSAVTVFPIAFAGLLGVTLQGRTRIQWRGNWFDMHYGDVDIELRDDVGYVLAWTARVGFSLAKMRYQLLGQRGALEFFNAMFRGGSRDLLLELEPNSDFAGQAFDPQGNTVSLHGAGT